MNIEIKKSNKLIPYKFAIKILEKRVNDIKRGKKNELLWILEHPLTYTAGVRYKNNEILDKKIRLIKTKRGGKITLHNPGQKIIYFAIDLSKRKRDVRRFVKIVEKSIIEFLNMYGVKSNSDRKNVGIWVRNKKIAAIGIRISRWVAYHGCSINISNDLDAYKKIIPCGLSNKDVTSLKLENKRIYNINKNLQKVFSKNFNEI